MLRQMKLTHAVLFIMLAAAMTAGAQANGIELVVDPLADGIALGGLALGAIGSEFIDEALGDQHYAIAPIESIPAWERYAMFPYSEKLDTIGDFAVVASLLLPILPAFVGQREVSLSRPIGKAESIPDWLEIGVMYGESLAAAYMLKNVLKSFIPRGRPYLYDPAAPAELALDPDSIRSFPSGHATLAFASAAFASTMFILRNPDSRWILPWTAACLGAASGIAIIRVESGAHFWGDALVGAGIGALAGTLTPLLHLRIGGAGTSAEPSEALAYSLNPSGITVRYRY
jgi:membrane-associated phospholipid phosphatase